MDSNDPSPMTVVSFEAREEERGVLDPSEGEIGTGVLCGVDGGLVSFMISSNNNMVKSNKMHWYFVCSALFGFCLFSTGS